MGRQEHWLDRVFLGVSPARRCFQDGWGAVDGYAEVSLERLVDEAPVPIRPAWSPVRAQGGMWLREGRFESPVSHLPAAARRGRVLWAGPEARAPEGVCVALAAWNDETFDFRLGLLGPLVRRGLVVLMLENPLYGWRRLPGRGRGTPRTVEEFLHLGFGTVCEARGLLAGLREVHPRVGVVGFSMGGHMAALTAASICWPVRVVTIAPSCTPASVFLDGMLAAGTSSSVLAGEVPAGGRLRALFDRFSVDRLPPPVAREHALVLGTRRDAIVPPSEPERIAAHWNARLRWLDTGHVGAVTLHRAALRAAVAEVFLT